MSLKEMEEIADSLYESGQAAEKRATTDTEMTEASRLSCLQMATATMHAAIAVKQSVEICRRLDLLAKLEEARFTQNELLIAELQMARLKGPLS